MSRLPRKGRRGNVVAKASIIDDLIEALRTLTHMRGPNGPRAFGNAWPSRRPSPRPGGGHLIPRLRGSAGLFPSYKDFESRCLLSLWCAQQNANSETIVQVVEFV